MASIRAENGTGERLSQLDGWRGISVLLILATHLLPLGPKALQLNDTTGPLGMVIFFILSGFLITRFLRSELTLRQFVIRRLARILPLAYVVIPICIWIDHGNFHDLIDNLTFSANLPPQRLLPAGSHLWSLCVEMQFYAAATLSVLLFGKRVLLIAPFMCIGITLYRVSAGAPIDIVTIRRVDEILAGCVLALIYEGVLGQSIKVLFSRKLAAISFVLLLLSCHPYFTALNYVRPYLAMIVIGSTILFSGGMFSSILKSQRLAYIANISFALYMIHHVLAHTWLAEGDTFERYSKRPLLFIATFALAHLSTFYFEKFWIDKARKFK